MCFEEEDPRGRYPFHHIIISFQGYMQSHDLLLLMYQECFQWKTELEQGIECQEWNILPSNCSIFQWKLKGTH